MKIDDLKSFQRMLQERDELLGFIKREFTAPYIGIYIPFSLERGFGHISESSQNLLLNDKSTVDAIMALALPAARKRVADIEAELTKATIEFS